MLVQNKLADGRYYFTKEHEWILVKGSLAFVGLTSLAKKELGPIEEIEIHTVGKALIENQTFGRIRSRKYLCKLIMPFNGKILKANVINYERFNTSDYEFDKDEWIAKIAITSLRSDSLFDLEVYKALNAAHALQLVKYFI